MTNLELPQESLIWDFARLSPKNLDSLYLNVVGIPSSSERTTKKKIYFWNYDKNYEEDKDTWEVDFDGDFGPFFDAIVDEKEFDYGRENPVSMRG